MNTLKFKTNIKCGGCMAQVSPSLNNTIGEDQWSVDINDPRKVLTVKTDRAASDIIKVVKEAGFEAETL